jgi:hypothetical protein
MGIYCDRDGDCPRYPLDLSKTDCPGGYCETLGGPDETVVHRAAPAWAWEYIDNMLEATKLSENRETRQIADATLDAMMKTSEEEYPS